MTERLNQMIDRWNKTGLSAERRLFEALGEIERLEMFLGEISAMGPADEEWDANTLEHAVEVAKRALTCRNNENG